MGDRAEQSDERETGAGDPLTDATTSLPTLQLAAEVRSVDTMSSALDDLCRLLNGGSCEVDHCSTIKRDGGVDAVARRLPTEDQPVGLGDGVWYGVGCSASTSRRKLTSCV